MQAIQEISIRGKTFVPFIEGAEIQKIVEELSEKIYYHYQGRTPVFVGVLNGVIMFFSDFLKKYPGNCEIAFIQLASYHNNICSSGKVDIISNWPVDLTDREVVIFEDIVDTGTTLEKINEMIRDQKVKSSKVATLFFKPDVYKSDLPVDYIGRSIPNRFIVGYGLDFDGMGRNIPDIYQLKD